MMTNEELIQSIQDHIDSGVGEYEGYGLTLDECRQVIKALKSQPFINKPCISEGVCREDKIQVLDKIRAEIENHCGFAKENHCEYCYSCPNLMGVKEILEVIDKYRTESEVIADEDSD